MIPQFLRCFRTCLFGLAAIGFVGSPGAANAEDCRGLMTGFVERLKAYEPVAARDMISDIDVHCPPQNRIAARSHLGFLVARLSQHERNQGASPQSVIDQATPYLAYADHWELQRTLGELSMETGDFAEAAKRYFRALDLMDDATFTPKPPNAVQIQNLHAAASTALSLSSAPISPKTRGNQTAAYFRGKVRGVQVLKITPQVTFAYDSDRFDPKGEKVAVQIAPILKQESPDRLVIIGHTDDRGSDAYNLRLSRQRVEFLQRFLREAGAYAGEIVMRWCGERTPVNIESVGRFNQDEIRRINRRVEVFYGQGGADKAGYDDCEG